MRIVEIEIIPISVPLRRAHKMGIGTVGKITSVLLLIKTDIGVVGIGEASPSSLFSYETQEGDAAILSKYIGPFLLNKDPYDLEAVMSVLDKNVKGNPFAKTAVDLAFYDIMGKTSGIPVYRLLGGRVRDEILMSWSLATSDIEEDIHEAEEMLQQGVRIFKIKAGVLNPEQDIQRIRAIRKALGPDPDLRVDANQAWTAEVALRVIDAIADCNITFVEQPVPAWDLEGMRRVCAKSHLPIMADESVFTADDALRFINHDAADIIGIKVQKHAGLLGSKKIAAIAKGAGLRCYLGCRMQLSVGAAASIHLGISTPEITYGCEEFCQLLTEDVIVDNPLILEKGAFRPYEGPGLGVALNREKVAKYQEGQSILIR